MLTQSQLSDVKFMAKLSNPKAFYQPLKAINFNEDVNILLSKNGLKAIVEDSKYIQAQLYVTKDCFTEFELMNNEEITLRVNLSILCDCLSIFTGTDCSMKMIYKGDGSPLVFLLEQHGEDDLVTECSIKTKNMVENMDFTVMDSYGGDDGTADTNNNDPYNTIIVRGMNFASLLNEIDKSAEELEVILSPEKQYFRLNTLGVIQSESTVEVAKTSDMVIKFSCQESSITRYRISHIRIPMKALNLSTKVALRVGRNSGVLTLQMMIHSQEQAQIYIEYFIMPLND